LRAPCPRFADTSIQTDGDELLMHAIFGFVSDYRLNANVQIIVSHGILTHTFSYSLSSLSFSSGCTIKDADESAMKSGLKHMTLKKFLTTPKHP
jgi:hypothetical protein